MESQLPPSRHQGRPPIRTTVQQIFSRRRRSLSSWHHSTLPTRSIIPSQFLPFKDPPKNRRPRQRHSIISLKASWLMSSGTKTRSLRGLGTAKCFLNPWVSISRKKANQTRFWSSWSLSIKRERPLSPLAWVCRKRCNDESVRTIMGGSRSRPSHLWWELSLTLIVKMAKAIDSRRVVGGLLASLPYTFIQIQRQIEVYVQHSPRWRQVLSMVSVSQYSPHWTGDITDEPYRLSVVEVVH